MIYYLICYLVFDFYNKLYMKKNYFGVFKSFNYLVITLNQLNNFLAIDN